MSQHRICSECGSTIDLASADGRCRRCLMDLAFQADDETEIEASLEASSVIQTGRTFGNY